MSTDTILQWLLRTAIEGSALVLIVLAIRWAMGSKLTPGWRVAMWSVVALKLVLPASLPTVGFGTLWPIASSDRVAVTDGSRGLQSTDSASLEMSSRSDEGTGSLSYVAGKDVVAVGSGVATRHMLTAFGDRGLKPTATFLDRYAVIVLWMVGVMAMLGLMIVRDNRFARALARLPTNSDRHLAAVVDDVARMVGLRGTPRIVLTEAATVPAVTGLFRPVLLMPRDWSAQLADDELDSILRHELLHLKHHDLWLNWIAALLNALHWFNPLVWIAVARCQEDRELRCDERALAIAEPAQRIAYGRVLLRFQEHFTAPPAIAGVAPCVRNHPPLHQRILMITQPSSHRPWFHALCFASLSLLVCVSFGSARAQEEKPGRTREGERTSPEATAPRKGGEEKGAMRKGEADGIKKRGEGDGAAKTGARDGEGGKKPAEGDGARKPGMRDGDGMAKNGARDGEGARRSAEGDGVKKPGMRDGEGARKSAEGDGARRPGMRDGEGDRKSAEGARNDKSTASPKDGLVTLDFENVPMPVLLKFYGELIGKEIVRDINLESVTFTASASKPLSKADAIEFIEASLTLNGYQLAPSGPKFVKCTFAPPPVPATIVLRVTDGGDTIIINGEKVPHAKLRGHLSEFLPEHRGDDVTIEADDDVPFKSVADVLDAARDNGAKGAKITSASKSDR